MAMKTGLENKKQVAIAAVLGVVLLGVIGYTIMNNFGGGSTPPPAAAAPAPVSSATPSTTAVVAQRRVSGHEAEKVGTSLTKLDPTLHPELMAAAESLEYTGKGRNIFSMSSVLPIIEAVKGPIRPGPTGPPAPTGPPPPPPIDLKFFGYSAENGARKAFLLHGDDVFIAIEGDVVDHHYKVVKISPVSIQVTDLLYNNTQTLPLTQS